MSKEKAIALLGTAAGLHDPIDIKALIHAARRQLMTEAEPVEGLELAHSMIAEAAATLKRNLPDWSDTPQEKAEKFVICESCLAQIKEFAGNGLKARGQGSLEVAEDLLKGQVNHNLQEFSENEGKTQVTITHDGKSVTTTPEKMEALTRAIGNDPRIQKIIAEGEE